MERLILLSIVLIYGIKGSSTQSLPCHTASGDNCPSGICPNTVVTYICTITSGTAAGYTDWILPSGACPASSFRDKLRLSQLVSGLCSPQGNSTCGPYTASSGPASDPTYCLSSFLTVNLTAAMNGSTLMCNNTNFVTPSITTIFSSATISIVGPPGSPNVAKTISPDMVLVILNPSSSGGLPTSYNVNISNSSYGYSNSTPAFLNGSAMVTFTGLTNSTIYTISAVAINCAGSSNPTTIYVSWPAPTPSPSTSSASNPSPTSPAPKPTPTPALSIGAIVGIVIGGVVGVGGGGVVIVVIIIIVRPSSKTSTKKEIKEQQGVQLEPQQPVRPPRDPPQAPSVPAEESLYNASTQNQRVPEESLYDGNVPTGRGGNVQEAVYSQPDTSKKNADKMTYATVQVTPAARNPPSGRAGRGVPPPNTSQQQDVFYSSINTKQL